MPVNLSIKNAPDEVVERLRRRAAKNHRSLQGELMAIIEAASETMEEKRFLTPKELGDHIRALGISSPSTSVDIIRATRDGGDDFEAEPDPMSPKEYLAYVRQMGLRTASDSADIIRADRDRDDSR
jgi:plasmid stability protein